MKKIILIVFVLSALSTNAQYFQNFSGTANDDVLVSGVNTVSNPGQIVAGESTPSVLNALVNGITITLTDLTGNLVFTKEFLMRDINSDRNTVDPHVFEFDNAQSGAVMQEFGVFGRYHRISGIYEMFYMSLDRNGNVTNITNISAPLSGYEIMDIGGISPSRQGTDVYVTGSARSTSATNTTHMFVMKYDYINNVIAWSGIYSLALPGLIDDISPQDIAEETANGNEVAIAGYLTHLPSNSIDAFTIVFDRFGGFPIQPIHHWGTANSDDRFYAIISSEQNQQSSQPTHGYVMAGQTDLGKLVMPSTDIDQWVLRSDPSLQGTALWTQTYSHSTTQLSDEFCYDIIERVNTAGDNEYFAIGHTSSGSYGGTDVLVNKIDWTGVAVANGEFMYGGTNDDYGVAIDFENTPANIEGFNAFGTWGSAGLNSLGGTDNYNVKAYFNGYSCAESIATAQNLGAPDMLGAIEIMNLDDNLITDNLSYRDGNALWIQQCFVMSNTNGSNARKAPGNEGSVSPNPFTVGTTYASLELEVDEPTTVIVAVYDMLGRNYYTQNFNLVKGKNNLSLDISEANMATGMYSVRITGEKLNQSIMLMVK